MQHGIDYCGNGPGSGVREECGCGRECACLEYERCELHKRTKCQADVDAAYERGRTDRTNEIFAWIASPAGQKELFSVIAENILLAFERQAGLPSRERRRRAPAPQASPAPSVSAPRDK